MANIDAIFHRWARYRIAECSRSLLLAGTLLLWGITSNAQVNDSLSESIGGSPISAIQPNDASGADRKSASDIERRGIALRAALEEKYTKLAKSNQIHGGIHGNDVTDIVSQYIPVGITFSEAQSVLQAAGFRVEPDPDVNAPNPNGANDWYAVIASISPYRSPFLSRVDVFVVLLPRSPGEYTDVTKITATFFTTTS